MKLTTAIRELKNNPDFLYGEVRTKVLDDIIRRLLHRKRKGWTLRPAESQCLKNYVETWTAHTLKLNEAGCASITRGQRRRLLQLAENDWHPTARQRAVNAPPTALQQAGNVPPTILQRTSNSSPFAVFPSQINGPHLPIVGNGIEENSREHDDLPGGMPVADPLFSLPNGTSSPSPDGQAICAAAFGGGPIPLHPTCPAKPLESKGEVSTAPKSERGVNASASPRPFRARKHSDLQIYKSGKVRIDIDGVCYDGTLGTRPDLIGQLKPLVDTALNDADIDWLSDAIGNLNPYAEMAALFGTCGNLHKRALVWVCLDGGTVPSTCGLILENDTIELDYAKNRNPKSRISPEHMGYTRKLYRAAEPAAERWAA